MFASVAEESSATVLIFRAANFVDFTTTVLRCVTKVTRALFASSDTPVTPKHEFAGSVAARVSSACGKDEQRES